MTVNPDGASSRTPLPFAHYEGAHTVWFFYHVQLYTALPTSQHFNGTLVESQRGFKRNHVVHHSFYVNMPRHLS